MGTFTWFRFRVLGFILWLWDVVSGTVFVTFSDCAQDEDGEEAIRAQMKYDRAAGGVGAVRSTAELAHVMLRQLQRALFNSGRVVFHGNIAPRGQRGNGDEFCIARVGKSWVIATEGGYTWSALRMFGLVEHVYKLKWELCIDYLHGIGVIDKDEHAELRETQFRSLYLSWLLRFHRLGFELPGQLVLVGEVCEDLADIAYEQRKVVVGYRDAFNNTYLLATNKSVYAVEHGGFFQLSDSGSEVQYVPRLKDLPHGQLCLVDVSAGYNGIPLLGLEAKAEPKEGGVWPDPLPGLVAGQKLGILRDFEVQEAASK